MMDDSSRRQQSMPLNLLPTRDFTQYELIGMPMPSLAMLRNQIGG